jgi:hypothetical protein
MSRDSLSLVQLVPNVVTILGMCAGLSAIRYTFAERYELAAALIIIAAILDGLDGLLARKLNAASRFGAELDSFADFVSFGVVQPVPDRARRWDDPALHRCARTCRGHAGIAAGLPGFGGLGGPGQPVRAFRALSWRRGAADDLAPADTVAESDPHCPSLRDLGLGGGKRLCRIVVSAHMGHACRC